MVLAGLPAGTYTIRVPYSDANGLFLFGGGVPNTLMITNHPGVVSDPAPSSINPSAISQEQTLLQLLLDVFESELETLLGQSTTATQADNNTLPPLAGW